MDFPPAEGSNCQRAFERISLLTTRSKIRDFVFAIRCLGVFFDIETKEKEISKIIDFFPNHLRTQVGGVGSNGFSIMAVHILNQVPAIQVQIQIQ